MRLIALVLSGFVFVVSAHAQSFNSYMLTPVDGGFNGVSPTGTPLQSDLVLLNRLMPGNTFSTTGLSLSSFASAADIQSVNARINQAFAQLNSNTDQLQRGIAAAVALPSAFMPSAPGRTSWVVNAATFNGDMGAGFSMAHRLNTSIPIAVTASYGYGGNSANVARLGLMGEF